MTILDPIYQGAAPILVSAGGISIDQAADFNWSGKHVFTSVTTEDIDQHINGNMKVDGFTLMGSNSVYSVDSLGGPNVLKIDETMTVALGTLPNAIYARLAVDKNGDQNFNFPMGLTAICADTDEAGADNSTPALIGNVGRIEINHKTGTHADAVCFRAEYIPVNSPGGTITRFAYYDATASLTTGGETIERQHGVNMGGITKGTIENWAIKLNGGNSRVGNDNDRQYLGTADDAYTTYDGADLVIDSAAVGTGRSKFLRALAMNIDTPAQITTSQVDYDLGNNTISRLSAAVGPFGIRGFVAGRPGELHIIVNVGANDFVINHESGTETTAANRIITLTGADVTLSADDQMTLWYDDTTSRWRQSS